MGGEEQTDGHAFPVLLKMNKPVPCQITEA